MASKVNSKPIRFAWSAAPVEEQTEVSNSPSRLRLILQRAALLYLGLFLSLSTLMSLAGLDPLIHNGALPKWLLVWVGLAVLLAWGNSESNLMEEQARSWLALYRSRPLGRRSDGKKDRF